MTDPLRMFLVLRRGAVETLERAAVLGGAAAVACVRRFDRSTPSGASGPGKVCLRARTAAQWEAVLEEPHALAGDPRASRWPRCRRGGAPSAGRCWSACRR